VKSELSAGARVVLAGAFLAALVIRVFFVAEFHGNFDVGQYERVAGLVRAGGNPYPGDISYNYSPLWAYVVAGLERASDAWSIPFAALVGGLLVAVDAATAWMLYLLGGRGRMGAAAAVLFFANPVSVIASGHYFQFDNVAILFLVVALYAASSEPPRGWIAAGALSVSLLVKHIAAFFPPLFVARGPGRHRIPLAAGVLPYAVFALSFVPFWRSWPGIRKQVFEYRGGTEEYGVGLLRGFVPAWLPTALFLVAVAAAVFAFRRWPLPRAGLMLFLVMLLFTPGICEYYFVWPIALGSLYGGAGYFVYTLVTSGFFMGGALEGLGLPFAHLPGWHGVWWSLVFWLAWEIRGQSILRSK